MEGKDISLTVLETLAAAGGDYYIDTTAVTKKRFSHIVVGPDGATIDDIKIRGVSVKVARNYGVLPANYIMSAGTGEYFDYIKLSAGNAQGLPVAEPSNVLLSAVSVADGTVGAALSATLSFTNDETKYGENTQLVSWIIRDSNGVAVLSGQVSVFFLSGSTTLTTSILGLTNPSAGSYVFEAKLEGSTAPVLDKFTTS